MLGFCINLGFIYRVLHDSENGSEMGRSRIYGWNKEHASKEVLKERLVVN